LGDFLSGKENAGLIIDMTEGTKAKTTKIDCGWTGFGFGASNFIGYARYFSIRSSFRKVNGFTPSHMSSLRLCCIWFS
jgi:hypothetical protein